MTYGLSNTSGNDTFSTVLCFYNDSFLCYVFRVRLVFDVIGVTCTCICIYMAVSRLFLYMELSPVVPIVRCLSFVRDLVCVMCGMKSVLCARLGLCYVLAQACAMCGL